MLLKRTSRPLRSSAPTLTRCNQSFVLVIPLLLCLWSSGQLSFLILTPLLRVHDSASLRGRKESKNAASSNSIKLGMNSSSTLYQDVYRLLHFPDESKIAVYFNKQRKCSHPQLIGRLSGSALTTVIWEKSHYSIPDDDDEEEDADTNNLLIPHDNNNNNNNGETWDALIGHYHVPQPGTYFLEIIAIMCEELQYETDFAGTCLVDPDFHRLTRDDVVINASSTSMTLQSTLHTTTSNHYSDTESAATGNTSSATIGYWWHDDAEQDNETFTPLYTRYQPQRCRDANASDHRCRLATDLSRFDHYKFKFSTLSLYDDEQLSIMLEGKMDKICVEGASHARRLRDHMAAVLTNLKATSIDINPPPDETKFVSDVDEERINRIIERNCTKVIIGSGQWDAGWPNGHPTLFPEYEKILNTTIPLMLKMFKDANIQVFYRSTHYNPIGDIIGSCPPTDWRSPGVIDMYNIITKRVCDRYGMPWINTHDIMGVMWDRAGDWCHYDDVSSDMEARYLIRRIFEP